MARAGKIGLFLAVAVAAGACSSGPKITPVKPAAELYTKANGEAGRRRFDLAAKSLESLVDTHPYDELTPHAELRLADMYFLDRQYPEAIAAYERFLKLHPTSQWAPYARYLLASAHYHQRESWDRDQTETQKASEGFDALIEKHADSEYAGLARGRLATVRAELAERQLAIGIFYARDKRYAAALHRFENVTRLYPEQPASGRAQLRAAECQLKLSKREEARETLSRLIHAAPGSEVAKQAESRLKSAGLEPIPAAAIAPAPSGARLSGRNVTP